MRAAVPLLAITLLAGCAQQNLGPAPAMTDAPVCYSKAQCDAMWAEAMASAPLIGGMRIQTATDTYFQTYNATGYGLMGAKARKMPRPDGSTAIESRFTCYFSCGHEAIKAVNLFNERVSKAGAGFGGAAAQQKAAGAPESAPGQLSKEQWRAQQLEQLKRETGISYDEYQRRYRQIMAD